MLKVRGLGNKIKQFQRILTFYAKVKKDTTQDKKATTQHKKDILGTKGQKGHLFGSVSFPERAWSLAWYTRLFVGVYFFVKGTSVLLFIAS